MQRVDPAQLYGLVALNVHGNFHSIVAKAAAQLDPLFTPWGLASAIGISETAVEFVIKDLLESRLLQRNGSFFEMRPMTEEEQSLCATELGVLAEEKLLDKPVRGGRRVGARKGTRVVGAAKRQKCGKKRGKRAGA